MHKKWTKKDIENEINKLSKVFDYPCDIPIEISKRATKRLGAFFYKNDRKSIIPIKFVFAEILLSGLYPEDIVKEVIIHEYIHYLCDTKTGVSNGHNKLFKDICIRCGINSNATLKYKVENNQAIKKNKKEYRIYCSCCKKIVCIHYRKDATDNKIKNYLSKCCKCKLKYYLIENNN